MLYNPEWQEKFLQLALLDRQEKTVAVMEELQRLIQPDTLATILDEFVYGTLHSPHHHTDSYAHDNGFDKIILFQDLVTKMKMRLHLWHPLAIPNAVRLRQNIHNHRWDFSSVVLTGYVDNHLYQFSRPDEDGEEFFHYRYYARGSKEHYDVESQGKTKLVGVGTERVIKGGSYSIEGEVLHRVDAPDHQFVATLVITHENVGWVTNDLLSERSLGAEQTTLPSPAMTRQKIVEKVENLRHQIGI